MWEINLEKYDAIVAQCDRFERKGKTMPYTSANGHMFSLMNKEGALGIRFSKSVQEHYLEKYQTTLFRSYNSVMRGYVLVPEELLDQPEKVKALLNESYDYVMQLDPK